MKEFTQFDAYKVEIWRRRGQRHMRLSVRPDGLVRVTCHLRVPKKQIHEFILSSHEFIERQKIQIENLREVSVSLEKVISGERLWLNGQLTQLEVIWSWTKKASGQIFTSESQPVLELVLPIDSCPIKRRLLLNKWLQQIATEDLSKRVQEWSERMGVKPTKISLGGAVTRWGSCSSVGEIRLNWKLIATPPWVRDYVVVHELSHMFFMNHSRSFWKVVATHYPAYRQAQEWLKKHERELAIQFQKNTSNGI